MEDYQEHSWISDDPPKQVRYDQHGIPLPSKVIAEYCLDEAPNKAGIWVLYHEANTPEPARQRMALRLRHLYKPVVEAVEDDPLRWVIDNRSDLLQSYANEWIAVKHGQVLGHSKDATTLVKLMARQKVDKPFIIKMAKSIKAWGTEYFASRV
jgi:hypothetical protein